MVFFCDDETKKMHGFRFIHLYCDINDDTKHHNMEFSAWMTKTKKNGHSILKRFQNVVIGMLETDSQNLRIGKISK